MFFSKDKNMCYRTSMSKKAQELAARYGRKSDILEILQEILEEEKALQKPVGQYHINAFKHPFCPIITESAKIHVAEWGLIPSWVRPKGTETNIEMIKRAASLRKGTINARSETLFQLPSFRGLVRKRRCLISSTGFFEHHRNPDKTKTPYFIFLKDIEIFSFGGLYDKWFNPVTGQTLETFTQITTPANPLLRIIHNGGENPFRMPLIISPKDEEQWLDHNLLDEDIEAFLKPYPDEKMYAYPIFNDFLKKNSWDERILERNYDIVNLADET